MIFGKDDWLVDHLEVGQEVKRYQQGGPLISWHDPRVGSTIFFFVIDDTLSDEVIGKLILYCQAFFHGLKVELVKPGKKVKETQRNGKIVKKHTLPVNFLEHH